MIGRVLSIKGRNGTAEFLPTVKDGEFIYYTVNANHRVTCQITSLQITPPGGVYGTFRVLETEFDLPQAFAELHRLPRSLSVGLLEIGTTPRGEPVKLALNPFFLKVLIPGVTGRGKTHLLTVLEEEFLKHQIPSLIIDPHGELIHLNQFSKDAFVTEELNCDDLIGYMKQRKTVVYNLQGYEDDIKAHRVYELISKLKQAKEQDYKHAESDSRLLEIPPIIVTIDETEIFSPTIDAPDPKCKAVLIETAKRGRQYGLGLVMATQRSTDLELKIRSQCNSAMIFRLIDEGSRKVIRRLPYVSQFEMSRCGNLGLGQCIVTGLLVDYPVIVNVRDIQTPRAKDVNFENMLNIHMPITKNKTELLEEPTPEQFQRTIKETRLAVQVVNRGASVDIVRNCPKCGKPLQYNRGKYYCRTESCTVISVSPNGDVTYAAALATSKHK